MSFASYAANFGAVFFDSEFQSNLSRRFQPIPNDRIVQCGKFRYEYPVSSGWRKLLGETLLREKFSLDIIIYAECI